MEQMRLSVVTSQRHKTCATGEPSKPWGVEEPPKRRSAVKTSEDLLCDPLTLVEEVERKKKRRSGLDTASRRHKSVGGEQSHHKSHHKHKKDKDSTRSKHRKRKHDKGAKKTSIVEKVA